MDKYIKSRKLKVLISLTLFMSLGLFIGKVILPKLSASSDTVEIVNDDVNDSKYEKVEHKFDEHKDDEKYKKSINGVRNILLIGVDGENLKDSKPGDLRSDVMIVLTIDGNSNILKLTSLMRDTLSYIPTSQTYQKLNHSYMEGGPEETLLTVNTNFGLDIDDYVVFDYTAVMKAVDIIGGYPVYVNDGEAQDMNIVEGEHILKGQDVAKYMRVRYNSGGDQGRNKRQRDLILYIMKSSKDMSRSEMIKFSTKMMPMINTSYNFFDIKELIDIYLGLRDNLDIEQHSFPFDFEGKVLQDKLWYAVPKNMKYNVKELHKIIYGENVYGSTRRLDEISNYIEEYSGVYKDDNY